MSKPIADGSSPTGSDGPTPLPPKRDRPPKGTIVSARFREQVKLAGSELKSWLADRHAGLGLTATARSEGLVFHREAGAGSETEDVIPWPNVAGYTRVR